MCESLNEIKVDQSCWDVVEEEVEVVCGGNFGKEDGRPGGETLYLPIRPVQGLCKCSLRYSPGSKWRQRAQNVVRRHVCTICSIDSPGRHGPTTHSPCMTWQ